MHRAEGADAAAVEPTDVVATPPPRPPRPAEVFPVDRVGDRRVRRRRPPGWRRRARSDVGERSAIVEGVETTVSVDWKPLSASEPATRAAPTVGDGAGEATGGAPAAPTSATRSRTDAALIAATLAAGSHVAQHWRCGHRDRRGPLLRSGALPGSWAPIV